LAKLLRLAQLGGPEAIRQIRRDYIEGNSIGKVVFDNDGFGLTPDSFLDNTFDVAIIDHRLPGTSGFDFVSALHTQAKVMNLEMGWLYICSQFNALELRVEAFKVGAIDCLFVADGLKALSDSLKNVSNTEPDYAVKSIYQEFELAALTAEEFQRFNLIFETLDVKEQQIIRSYAELKSDALIAQAFQVPKLKVRNTLMKVANLLFLSTRGQLLLLLKRLGSTL
jgi:DNA-binding NarL/FixJ family response regulator